MSEFFASRHVRRALFLDVETTGLSAANDKITEICVVVVAFWDAPDWEITRLSDWRIVQAYSGVNDPGRPVPAAVQKLTHLDAALLDGQKFSTAILKHLASKCEFIVAWNSPFDQGFVDAAIVETLGLPWVDAQRDFDWAAMGAKYQGLDYVSAVVGRFVNPFPHSAFGDVMSMARPVAPLLGRVNIDAKAGAPKVVKPPPPPMKPLAFDLGRSRNDELKAEGFRWTSVVEGKWAKLVPESEYEQIRQHYEQLFGARALKVR